MHTPAGEGQADVAIGAPPKRGDASRGSRGSNPCDHRRGALSRLPRRSLPEGLAGLKPMRHGVDAAMKLKAVGGFSYGHQNPTLKPIKAAE